MPQWQPSEALYLADRLVEDVVIIGVQFLKARYFKPNLTLFEMVYCLEQPVSQRSAVEFRIPFNCEREICWIDSVDGSLGQGKQLGDIEQGMVRQSMAKKVRRGIKPLPVARIFASNDTRVVFCVLDQS